MNDRLLRDYILFDYQGVEVSKAEVSILYGNDTYMQGYINVTNIVPLEKSRLSTNEYNNILMVFYRDIIEPYGKDHPKLRIEGPTSDLFNPLTHISCAPEVLYLIHRYKTSGAQAKIEMSYPKQVNISVAVSPAS